MLTFSSIIIDLFGLNWLPSVHGGGDDDGGVAGVIDSLLANITRALEAEGGFQWLPGVAALGLNLHPYLVHFPIAFLSGFVLLEWTATLLKRGTWHTTATALLLLGSIGAVLTAAAGLYAASTVPHGQAVHDIMEWHERLGLTVTTLALILSGWRLALRSAPTGMARALFLLLSSLLLVCLAFGADLGGLMVYEHGVAVHHLQLDSDHHQHP